MSNQTYIFHINLQEPTEEPFPEVLKQLQHKEYTVILKMTEDNIKNGSTVYEEVGLKDAPESYANFSPSNKNTAEEEMSIEQVDLTI